MAKMIDYTKYRKGSRPNGRIIDYCPKCKRKGEKTIYKNGAMIYVHQAKIMMFVEVTDYCHFRPEEQ